MLSGRAQPYKQRACSIVAVSASWAKSARSAESITIINDPCWAAVAPQLVTATSSSHLQLIHETPEAHAPRVHGIAADVVPSSALHILSTARQVSAQYEGTAVDVAFVAAAAQHGAALPTP